MDDHLKPPRVDAHFHLDLFPDPVRSASARTAAQIYTIAVTNAPSVFFHTEALARKNPVIVPAAGLHPELAHSHGNELASLLLLVSNVRVIGEVGLDYTRSHADELARQREIFAEILSKCSEVGNRVLSVHSRRSSSDVISMIGHRFPGTVILHWFTGTAREAKRAVSMGCFFSVNCAMARSDRGRRILQELPPERVLTESDAPFLQCCPGHDGQPFGQHIVLELSRLWGQSVDDVYKRIFENFETIFPEYASRF